LNNPLSSAAVLRGATSTDAKRRYAIAEATAAAEFPVNTVP
jgi:hypothetical protein